MSKSTKAQQDKQTKVDEYQIRIDGASTTIAELTEGVKTLEAEVAEMDKAQAEATKQRTTEHEDYVKASTDFKDSAEAVAKAIEVLKSYYSSSFVQVAMKTSMLRAGPAFGSAKSD